MSVRTYPRSMEPLTISSGYRSWQLNNAIQGASKTSAHSLGYAADIIPCNGSKHTVTDLENFVKEILKKNKIAYDQYIDEKKGNSQWVHLGIRNSAGQQRRQNLVIRK